MLVELHVENLGIVDELTLEFLPGMTAITGETGAGKTLVVTALGLLVGGRADASMVRDGASEARVDGRFSCDGDEIVLTRVVSREGRSRAYRDGRPVTAGQLDEIGVDLVDLHGQHTHQSLLNPAAQRLTLDHYAGSAVLSHLETLRSLRRDVAEIDASLRGLGGDPRARAREIDLLAFQIDEIESAAIDAPDEHERLGVEEALLSEADAHREALGRAHEVLDGTAVDAVGEAIDELRGRTPFEALEERLRTLQAELSDASRDLRHELDETRVDPQRLDEVRARRALLTELRRKYGNDLAEVLAFADQARERLAELRGHDELVDELDVQRRRLEAQTADAAIRLSAARRAVADPFSAAVVQHLRELAMPDSELSVEINDAALTDSGADEVRFLLAPNAGESPRLLHKAASGGELSRTMLAIRLVLSEAPPTLVFDEVDAGIGGEAGSAVGRALARLGAHHQLLVVTHLAQVAACAASQIAVAKVSANGRTVARARPVAGNERVEELSRMLAGESSSDTSRRHAAELLEAGS